MARDRRGWHREPVRHGLAAKGIKTARQPSGPHGEPIQMKPEFAHILEAHLTIEDIEAELERTNTFSRFTVESRVALERARYALADDRDEKRARIHIDSARKMLESFLGDRDFPQRLVKQALGHLKEAKKHI